MEGAHKQEPQQGQCATYFIFWGWFTYSPGHLAFHGEKTATLAISSILITYKVAL